MFRCLSFGGATLCKHTPSSSRFGSGDHRRMSRSTPPEQDSLADELFGLAEEDASDFELVGDEPEPETTVTKALGVTLPVVFRACVPRQRRRREVLTLRAVQIRHPQAASLATQES